MPTSTKSEGKGVGALYVRWQVEPSLLDGGGGAKKNTTGLKIYIVQRESQIHNRE